MNYSLSRRRVGRSAGQVRRGWACGEADRGGRRRDDNRQGCTDSHKNSRWTEASDASAASRQASCSDVAIPKPRTAAWQVWPGRCRVCDRLSNEGWARRFFDNWRASLKWQRLKPYERFADMIERHWDGIASFCKPENKVSLGFVEGLNNKIRVFQRRAYGLRDEEYLRLKVLTCMLDPL